MTTPAKHDALQTKPSDGAPATPTRSPVARLTAKSSEPAWAMIDSNIDPQHVVLRISDLMLRYDCSKTTACALVNEPDFPGQVAPRCWRLDHVMESEDARAWAGRVRPTAAPADYIASVQRSGESIVGGSSQTRTRKAAV